MSNVRGLYDKGREDRSDDDDPNRTDSFVGGHKSGLALQYPKPGDKGTIRVKIFTNGLIINDGPFLARTSDECEAFIQALRNESVPAELQEITASREGELPIELIQVDGAYTTAEASTGKPVTSPPMFGGAGVSLGGEQTLNAPVGSLADRIPIPELDSTEPRTSIQIRLPGGERVTRQFHRSSKGSLLLDVLSAGMQVGADSITISTSFPPRPISAADLTSMSLEELGLCNASVNISIKR